MARSGRNSKRSSRRRRSMKRRRQSGGNSTRNVHWQNFFDLGYFEFINLFTNEDIFKAILCLIFNPITALGAAFIQFNLSKIILLISTILKLDLIYTIYDRNSKGRIETGKLFGYEIFGKSESISIEKTFWAYIPLLSQIILMFFQLFILSLIKNVDGSDSFLKKLFEYGGNAIVYFLSLVFGESQNQSKKLSEDA